MTQGNYISETQQIPVLDLRNWQENGMNNIGNGTFIKTLSPACTSITVKNTYTVTDSSIVICTTSAPGSCPTAIPGSCPTTVTPADYLNLLALVHAATAENGVPITFQYILNGAPGSVTVSANLTPTDTPVYAFATNIGPFPNGTTFALYGVSVPT